MACTLRLSSIIFTIFFQNHNSSLIHSLDATMMYVDLLIDLFIYLWRSFCFLIDHTERCHQGLLIRWIASGGWFLYLVLKSLLFFLTVIKFAFKMMMTIIMTMIMIMRMMIVIMIVAFVFNYLTMIATMRPDLDIKLVTKFKLIVTRTFFSFLERSMFPI